MGQQIHHVTQHMKRDSNTHGQYLPYAADQGTRGVGTDLRVTALQQSPNQAGQQHCVLGGGCSAISSTGGRQQASKPGSVVVQDVANVLQGCLPHRQGMIC